MNKFIHSYYVTLSLATVVVALLPRNIYSQSTYRPDSIFTFGSSPSPVPEFGLTDLTFSRSGPTFMAKDSQSQFTFSFSDVNYVHPKFRLYGNGCALVRDITDTVDQHTRFAPNSFHANYCRTVYRAGSGWQFILPLGEDVLLYGSEMLQGENSTQAYYSHVVGYGLSYLSIDRLANKENITKQGAVLKSHSYISHDTSLHETFDHVSDGAGGWWGVARAELSPHYIRWHLTSDTILSLSPVAIGVVSGIDDVFGTRLQFNAQGTAFAFVGSKHGITLCHFNRETADITFWQHWSNSFYPDWVLRRTPMACEWSADGRFLYVALNKALYQFDTWADDIEGSAVRISRPFDEYPNAKFYDLERGPDCRIYAASFGQAQSLSVIDRPGHKGVACNLKPKGLYMRRYVDGHLPEFPDYSLWAKDRVARGLAPVIDTAVCDSSIAPYPYFDWTSAVEETNVTTSVEVFPNPISGSGTLTVRARDPLLLDEGEVYLLRLIDGLGREVVETRVADLYYGEVELALPDLPSGLYVLQVSGTRVQGVMTTGVVVQ